jgi:hypothetical protein
MTAKLGANSTISPLSKNCPYKSWRISTHKRWVESTSRIPQRRRCDRFFSPNSTTRHL